MLNVTIDTTSVVAPYEQLRTEIARQVASGELPSGTRLATVRQMAADLGLAANTVARAYRQLETDGVIATHGRRGTFVSSDVLDGTTSDSVADARAAAQAYATTARRLGLTRAEATRLVELAWS